MKRPLVSLILVMLLAVLSLSGLPPDTDTTKDPTPDGIPLEEAKACPTQTADDLVLSVDGFFTENLGQLDSPDGLFIAQGREMSIVLGDGWLAYHMPSKDPSTSSGGQVVRMWFEGCDAVVPQGRSALVHRTNYLLESDEGGWVKGARSFREVVYQDLWQGVGLRFYFSEGLLKYDLIVHPWGSVDVIAFTFEGAEKVGLDPSSGDLLITTRQGLIRDQAPVAFQGEDDSRKAVPVEYTLSGDGTVGFDVGDYDPEQDLVVDPGIDWCTYLGGNNLEYMDGFAVDGDGNVYVAGWTHSTNFPTTAGAYSRTKVDYEDLVVCKLNSAGSKLLYSTFVGGSSGEWVYDMGIDGEGAAYVVGETSSTDFPTTANAFRSQVTSSDVDEGFLFKLSPAGNALQFSTYIGSAEWDRCDAMAVVGKDLVFVGGMTNGANFPTTVGAYDRTYDPDFDLFCMKVDTSSGSILASTLVGGTDREFLNDMAVDPDGNPYLTGYTEAEDFPTTDGAYDTVGVARSGIVVKFNSDLTDLEYSTYLGADGHAEGFGICVDGKGRAIVAGTTNNTDFPTTGGAFCETYNVDPDRNEAFVLILDPAGSAAVSATLLGGRGADGAYCVQVDGTGNVYAGGYTNSKDFPTTPNALTGLDSLGTWDAFLTVFSPSLNGMVYSTLFNNEVDLGGSRVWQDVIIEELAIDSEGQVLALGWSEQKGLPTTAGAYMQVHQGSTDCFIFRMDRLISYPPEILLDATPPSVFTNERLRFEVSARDDVGIGGVWVEFVYTDGAFAYNLSMQRVTGSRTDGTWRYAADMRQDELVPLTYRFHVQDDEGHVNSTRVRTVILIDGSYPTVIIHNDERVEIGRTVTINIEAMDNHGISDVTLTYWFGAGTSSQQVHITPRTADAKGRGTYVHEMTIPRGQWEDLHFNVSVTDIIGHTIRTQTRTVDVADVRPPKLSDWTVSTLVFKGASIDFTVRAEDDGLLESVHLLVKMGNLQLENRTMKGDGLFTATVSIPRYIVGDITFKYSAGDAAGNWYTTPQMTAVPVNDPPRLEDITEWAITEGVYSLLDLADYIVDDNDPIHDIIVTCDDTDVLLDGQRLSASFDSWEPEHEMTITLEDPETKTEWKLVLRIVDVNDPPSNPMILTPSNGQTIREGELVSFNVLVEDPDEDEGQELTIVWESDVQGELWRGGGTGTFTTELVPGTHTIDVTVTDGEFERSAHITITVEEASDGDTKGTPGGTILLALMALGVASLASVLARRHPGKS